MGPDLVVIVALVLGGGMLAGVETAVLGLRRSRLAQLVEQRRRGARGVAALRERPERLLATVQAGVTVIGAGAAAWGGATLAAPIGTALKGAGLGEMAAAGLAFAAVVAGVSYLWLVLGELVPKSLATRHAEGYALLSGRPLVWLSTLLRPLIWLLTASANLLLRPFGGRASFQVRFSREELQELVDEAARSGALDRPVGEIAARAIRLGDLPVSAVMVPWPQVVALPRTASKDELKRLLLESGHSRMPVYGEGLNDVVGYVMAKDVLAMIWEEPLIVLEDIVRPPVMLAVTTRMVDALRELQRRRTQLAVLRDADGGVAGIVTVEDMVEELVGEIVSEDEPDRIRRSADGSALVRGAVPVREINRELGLRLPEDTAWMTIAGLCIGRAGWMPAAGARLKLDDGTELEVVEATSRRIDLVRIRPGAAKTAG